MPFLVPILHRLSLKGVDRFPVLDSSKKPIRGLWKRGKIFMPESPQLTPMANELNVAYLLNAKTLVQAQAELENQAEACCFYWPAILPHLDQVLAYLHLTNPPSQTAKYSRLRETALQALG